MTSIEKGMLIYYNDVMEEGGKLKETLANIQGVDRTLIPKTQNRLDNLTKPLGSLGLLERIARDVVVMTGKENPNLKNKVIFTLAADHGISDEGVSAYPKVVTSQMVYNFIRGGAGINVLARHVGAKVVVVDMGVALKLKIKSLNFKDKKINLGTRNFTKGPAMTRKEAIRSIETGIGLVEEELKNNIDIIGTGDMGIGNTTPSSAITSFITGKDVKEITGRGTGIDDNMLKAKIEAIEKAINVNKPNINDPIDILASLGGFEIGGIVGILLGGARYKIPVIIDGFISGASSLIAYKISQTAKEYWFAGHASQEPGHRVQLQYLQLEPILDLKMRLGEGTGACLSMTIIDAACKILNEMATFSSASVSKRL